MKRGTYAKNLVKQIKLRLDEDAFRKITNLSEKTEKTKSWIMRDIINVVMANETKIANSNS